MSEPITMLRENLSVALMGAIYDRTRYEERAGYTVDSALLAGWKEILEALREGREVVIK